MSTPTWPEPDCTYRIVVQRQGGGPFTPTVAVKSIHEGIDWDSGKLLIYPAQPLTTLTPDEVEAIKESVRKGGSWHAYQAYKVQELRIKELEEKVAKLTSASEEAQASGLNAAIAWSVCASIHREFGDGRDPFFTTRQADFVHKAEEAQSKLSKEKAK